MTDVARRGDELHGLVAEYAALGDHRTGTEIDDATVDWLADHLVRRGLDVTREPVPFDRYVVDSELIVDGQPVDHLPVFYEFVGSVRADAVEVRSFDPRSGGLPGVLDDEIGGDPDLPLVLATEHPDGSLVAVNRHNRRLGSGRPVVLVAGRDRRRLEAGRVELRVDAAIERSATTNLVATNRAGAGGARRPQMLTTPLTGWFRCAGERGTGVAVLLDLVERLEPEPLLVVATGGHELGWFGAEAWVDRATQPVSSIVHLGASLAVVEPSGQLVATRLAMTSLDAVSAAPVADAVAAIGLDLVTEPGGWIGEAEAWSRIGVPMLSLTGAGIDFHTPGDTPRRATTPTALASVAGAVEEAVRALARGSAS